jgi:hypothetical protein
LEAAQVSIQLGLFDVFTYTIPGSLYLALIAYVTDRLGWIDIASLKTTPDLVLAGALLIASYVVGFATSPVAEQLDHGLRHWLVPKLARSLRPWLGPRMERLLWSFAASNRDGVRKEFEKRAPGAESRAYIKVDQYLLLALAEASKKEAALEISRFRATGLMLRNCAVPFLLASMVCIGAAAGGANLPAALICALLFAGAVPSCIGQGKQLRQWAEMKTLQICYWIPDIDGRITPADEN